MRRIAALCLFTLVLAGPLGAGPWLRDPRLSFLSFQATPRSNGQVEYGFYGERGMTPRLTLGLDLNDNGMGTEAVSLVLEAAVIGKQDDVFVFDMGQSIKIMDLAKKMIALAGMEEGKDIEVAITGLRPGEKMHEELLSNRESLLPTHHSKIMRANTPPSLKAEDLERIIALSQTKGAHPETLSLLHALIPEYSSSQNR